MWSGEVVEGEDGGMVEKKEARRLLAAGVAAKVDG